MARSINQVVMMGNLTRDPDLRTTPNGQTVTNFSLALNRSYKGSDGNWVEDTDYIDCVAWGPLGERVSQYLQKGRRCLVQGRLSQRSWEQDGQKRSKVEVVASDVTFLDGSGGEGGNADGGGSSDRPASKNQSKNEEPSVESIDDSPIDLSEIPF
jgi:single-strand DNA-binding protein